MTFWYWFGHKMGLQKWCHRLPFSFRIGPSPRMDAFKGPLLHVASLWARFMSPVACFLHYFGHAWHFLFNHLNWFRHPFASIYDFAAGTCHGQLGNACLEFDSKSNDWLFAPSELDFCMKRMGMRIIRRWGCVDKASPLFPPGAWL